MGRSVVYTEAELNDLGEITAYISADNPEAEKRFSNRLIDLAESLKRMPAKGRRVKGWTDLRVIVLSPYLIFYRLETEPNRIVVLRFWHGARDPGGLRL